MRKVLALVAVAVAGSAFAATPASAAACSLSATCAVTTIATTVDVGTLGIIAAPVSGSLSFTSVPTGGVTQTLTNAADLTLTTVTDTRLSGTGWAVTANVSNFTGVPGGSIPRSAVKLSVPAAPIKVLGAVGMTITPVSTLTAVDGAGDLANFVVAAGTGGLNTVTYIPHVDITVPAGTAAGVYTGTLTQSVA